MQASKLKQHVEFAETLDLGPFMRSRTQQQQQQQQQLYELCGVVVHDGGSVRSGHYYSYVRNSNGIW
jgi:ubiquitin carboxyl-terminal hydrolase 36/42